jgi:hypothetical protein
MMRFDDDNNNGWGWLIVLLIALFVFSNLANVIPFVLLVLALGWFANRMGNERVDAFKREIQQSNAERDAWDESLRRERQPQSEPIYRHALMAVEAAGLNPDKVPVLAVDLGVLAYKGDESPKVYRTWTVPDDIDYIQPFVQLRLPSKADGLIRFEILDSEGRPLFIREDVHHLERGRNFITPAARMPVYDQQEMDGNWQLRISADNVLLAVHTFSFGDATSATVRRAIGEDGEINSELRLMMEESKPPKMSLDELLASQEEDDEKRRRTL